MGFLCFFFLFGCTCISVPSFVQPVRPLEEQVFQGKGPGKILLVDISGTISEKRKSKGICLAEEMSMVERIKEELNKETLIDSRGDIDFHLNNCTALSVKILDNVPQYVRFTRIFLSGLVQLII